MMHKPMTAESLMMGYCFQDPALLEQALTHPSAARSRQDRGYERLEFLGDRVLALLVADMLYRSFPTEQEGQIARRHASLVRKEALSSVAMTCNLAAHLRVPVNEAASAITPSVLADVCEAILGAIYLDGGLEAVRPIVEQYWRPLLAADLAPPQDAKSALQEWAQARGYDRPVYTLTDSHGPAHKPVFSIVVTVTGLAEPIEGTGTTRKLAEQEAARLALIALTDPV